MSTPLQWSLLAAFAWALVVWGVWRSLSPGQVYFRRVVLASGAVSVGLILLTGALIRGYVVNVTNEMTRQLPGTSQVPQDASQWENEVTVSVVNDETVALDGVALPMRELEEELEKRKAAAPGLTLTLFPSPDVKYDTIKKILDVCEKAKIDSVSYRVSEEE